MIEAAAEIRLILGLGNPGNSYGHHRHNAGFWCINQLARRWGVEMKNSRTASIGEFQHQHGRIVIAKPRTFMNESGRAASALLSRYHLQHRQMLVAYDSLDMPAGQVRIRPAGGHGGHNGLRSVIEAVGSQQFPRAGIGIGRPVIHGRPVTDPEIIARYVLSSPSPEERRVMDEAVQKVVDAIICALDDGIEAAMSRYNG